MGGRLQTLLLKKGLGTYVAKQMFFLCVSQLCIELLWQLSCLYLIPISRGKTTEYPPTPRVTRRVMFILPLLLSSPWASKYRWRDLPEGEGETFHVLQGSQNHWKVQKKALFEKISSGKVNVEIFNKYKLEDIKKAHVDLENRKVIGPAIIVP